MGKRVRFTVTLCLDKCGDTGETISLLFQGREASIRA